MSEITAERYYANKARMAAEGEARGARIKAAREARKAAKAEFRMVCPSCQGTSTKGITAHLAKCSCGHTFQGYLASLVQV